MLNVFVFCFGVFQKENESNLKNLNSEIDGLKSDNQSMANKLNEQLNELGVLREKLKMCEEELACNRDERIAKLEDCKRTLEREIESLKTAIDIKNKDISELRTKNNELYTKVCDLTFKLNVCMEFLIFDLLLNISASTLTKFSWDVINTNARSSNLMKQFNEEGKKKGNLRNRHLRFGFFKRFEMLIKGVLVNIIDN